ncbi:transposase [Streptomyces sp. NPDC016845]|uniref:transposase n=1 Tax=Streptomyces sp. NPDC016845 TaxID=3364972 RepID=UPI00379EF9BE
MLGGQSANPLKLINREIKRHTGIVQDFPNDDALLRLFTAVLLQLHDEWTVFPRRCMPEGGMAKLYRERPDGASALPKTTTNTTTTTTD